MSCEDSRADAIKKAVDAGLKVVYGDEQTLQLDIDSLPELEFARKMLKDMRGIVKWSSVICTVSKSGNWHLYVHLKKPSARPWRILMQACLGSDRKRELLNQTYADHGSAGECFFFEKEGVKRELFES